MWISIYYMQTAVAHLVRIFTRSAPAKMHILLFEVAKKMTVDHLCRKNLLHFVQITCTWRETEKYWSIFMTEKFKGDHSFK